MKTILLLIIISLAQVGCVTTVTDIYTGEEYYHLTIPFTLNTTPVGIAEEILEFTASTQIKYIDSRDFIDYKSAYRYIDK